MPILITPPLHSTRGCVPCALGTPHLPGSDRLSPTLEEMTIVVPISVKVGDDQGLFEVSFDDVESVAGEGAHEEREEGSL
jgi:hypothetical protein